MAKWIVHTKYARRESDFEICVINLNNKHGFDSWGWPSDDKIIFSARDYSEDMALKCAKLLCNALNKETSMDKNINDALWYLNAIVTHDFNDLYALSRLLNEASQVVLNLKDEGIINGQSND